MVKSKVEGLLSWKIISVKQHWLKTRLAIRTLLVNSSNRNWNKAKSLHVKFQKYLQCAAAPKVTQGKGPFGSCLPNCFSRAGKLSAKLWQRGEEHKTQSWRNYGSESLLAQRLNYINLQKDQDDVWQVHGDAKDFSSSVDADWAQGVMFSMAGTRCSSAPLKEINGGRQ